MTALSAIWLLLRETFNQWREDNVSRLAAALAYYAAFSLAPVLVISIAIAGFVFDEQSARNELIYQIRQLVGTTSADAVAEILSATRQQSANILASLIGLITLLFGATGVFTQLQESLDKIWGVAPRPERGFVRGFIEDRIFSFALVLGIGFLLLVSLIISALISGLRGYFDIRFPDYGAALQVGELFLSLFVITLLFALIYKILPRVQIRWKDVFGGALLASVMFNIGKLLFGLYLGNSAVASSYGAAGSLIVILLWVYFTAQILYFGAEFTQVYTHRYGSHLQPDNDAVFVRDITVTMQQDEKAKTTDEGLKREAAQEGA